MNPFASSHGEQATKRARARTANARYPGSASWFMLMPGGGSAVSPLAVAKDHERAAATGQAGIAVVIDGPSRRPHRASDLAPRTLHTDAHSIRREQLGLVGAVGGGCSRRTRARAEMFRTKADPTKRELQDDPARAPGRTTKTQDLQRVLRV